MYRLSFKEFFWIGDVREEEGVAWYRCTCGTAVFLLDDFTKLLDGQYATSHIKKGTNDSTHHIAEETVGSDGELPFDGRHLFPSCKHNTTVVGLHIGVEF